MIKTCEDCSLRTCEITDDQLAAGWCLLILDDKARKRLASDEYAAFDSDAARSSTDPTIRKNATGRAIAICLQRHDEAVATCSQTAEYQYANIDDPTLPINL